MIIIFQFCQYIPLNPTLWFFKTSWIQSTINCESHLLCAGLHQVWWKHISEMRNNTVVKRFYSYRELQSNCEYYCSFIQTT